MSRKRIGKNTGNSGRVNLSGLELQKFGVGVGDSVKVDIAESKSIARAMVDNSDHGEFVIVSKPESKEGNR